jgi:hypothetical protein
MSSAWRDIQDEEDEDDDDDDVEVRRALRDPCFSFSAVQKTGVEWGAQISHAIPTPPPFVPPRI